MSGDSYFSSVALFVQGDTYNDLSYNQYPSTVAGVTIGSGYAGSYPLFLQYKAGLVGQPLYFNAPQAANIAANIDFTIEVEAFCQMSYTGYALYSNRTNTGVSQGLLIGIDPQGRPFVRATSGGTIVIEILTNRQVSINATHLFSLQRRAGVWTLFIDGIPYLDVAHTNIWNGAIDGGNNVYLGCDPQAAVLIGALNQVRVTMGVARYSGQYGVSLLPFVTYSTNPNITFGALSNAVAKASNPFIAQVLLTNTVSVSVTAVNGANQPVGSGWTISADPSGLLNSWIINGIAPGVIADFNIVIAATTPPAQGSLTTSHSYHIANTATGTLSQEQAALEATNQLALWIDASDNTTISTSSGNITQVVDKANGIVFSAAPNKTPPVLNTTAFGLNSIGFPNGAASGLLTQTPVVVTDAASDSTIFLVGSYTGQQMGQGGGVFQLSYLPDTTVVDGTTTWVISTTNVGGANATLSAYDNSASQDGVTTAPVLQSGAKFLATWRSMNGLLQIFVNQNLVATTLVTGQANVWNAVNAAISFIGGAQSPTGAFISLGELIAISADLDNSTTEQIESYLNHKWSIYPFVPFAQTPSTLSGYIGNNYAAQTIITDATSVSVSASAGTGWAIAPSVTGVLNQYTITGVLPTTPQQITLTITTHNGAILGTDSYTITALALPTTPVIMTPDNLACQQSSGYVSAVYVESADSVSITANAGSGWSIVPGSIGINGNYMITGLMPSTVGTVILTITATKTTDGVVQSTTANFAVLCTTTQIALTTQYPLDLTGVASSNLINAESQTLTTYNGPLQQLLVPILAPFFGASMLVQYYNLTGVLTTAVAGVDYELVFKYNDISEVADADVFGGLSFMNPNIHGTVYLTYQTVGGNYAVDSQYLIEQLFSYSLNPQFVSWNAVTGKPRYFPVNTHYLNMQNDTVGYAGLVSAMTALATASATAVADSDVAAMTTHMLNTHNPHSNTANTIGLGSVANYALATPAQAIVSTNTTTYLTPMTAYIAVMNALPHATVSISGKMTLNLGIYTGDDTNTTKGLTPAGVINLLTSPTANALNTLFQNNVNAAQVPVQVNPAPPNFPLYWKGIQYANVAAFVNAVETYVGIAPIPYNQATGTFYFPVGVTPPSLLTTSTPVATTTVLKSVMGAVNQPILITP